MMRHKHIPKGISDVKGFDMDVEECVICGKRRIVHIGWGRKTTSTYWRWLSKNDTKNRKFADFSWIFGDEKK